MNRMTLAIKCFYFGRCAMTDYCNVMYYLFILWKAAVEFFIAWFVYPWVYFCILWRLWIDFRMEYKLWFCDYFLLWHLICLSTVRNFGLFRQRTFQTLEEIGPSLSCVICGSRSVGTHHQSTVPRRRPGVKFEWPDRQTAGIHLRMCEKWCSSIKANLISRFYHILHL